MSQRRTLAICIALLSAAAYTASASTFDWTGNQNTDWSNNSNWHKASGTGNPPPGGADIANFITAAVQPIVPAAGSAVGEITYAAGSIAYNISGAAGSTLTINGIAGNGIVNSGSQVQTISVPTVALGNNQLWNAGAGGLNILSALNLGANALTVTGTADTTIAGVITGTGSLTKNGTDVLNLNGANTYSGGTTLSAGTISLGAAQNTGPLTLAGGTLVQANSSANNFTALNVSGSSQINLAPAGSLNFGTATYSSGLLTINNWLGQGWDATAPNVGANGSAAIFIGTQPSDTFLANVQFTGFPQGSVWVNTINGPGELVPVPEPATYGAIFALGLLGFAFARRQMLARA